MAKELETLMNEFDKFNDARGWHQAPEDLAKSIIIEAAELLECFQWDGSLEGLKIERVEKNWEEVGQEVADVFLYLARFCSVTGIDLPEAVEKKIKHIAVKYPEKEFKEGHNDRFYKGQKKKYRE